MNFELVVGKLDTTEAGYALSRWRVICPESVNTRATMRDLSVDTCTTVP